MDINMLGMFLGFEIGFTIGVVIAGIIITFLIDWCIERKTKREIAILDKEFEQEWGHVQKIIE